MGSVANIVAAVKVRVAAVAATYTELAYAKDLTKNTFKDNHKRFGVIPKSASESQSVTRSLTLDQEFELILTQGFINKPMSDSEEQAKAIELQDLVQSIYLDLVQTKAGVPSTCISVADLSLETPETDEQHKLLIQRATFKIKYRTSF